MPNETSKIKLNPYLFFTGNCKEAMEFYKEVFGGELSVQTFKDAGMESEGIMHAELSDGQFDLLACDGDRKEPYETSFISLCVSGTDTEKLTRVFDQLSGNGKVTSPLKVESWGDTFGTLT